MRRPRFVRTVASIFRISGKDLDALQKRALRRGAAEKTAAILAGRVPEFRSGMSDVEEPRLSQRVPGFRSGMSDVEEPRLSQRVPTGFVQLGAAMSDISLDDPIRAGSHFLASPLKILMAMCSP